MSNEAKKKAPRAAASYRSARRAEMIIRLKARRKAALIHERASQRPAPKPWKWQRATPRAS